ncbi:MAG: Hsp20/alpha crystallin family protein [Longimicrobiales bacterium]|nr:Hsp20/alpha crystallin family protein [Longimicrobiales bacterium]
MVRMPVVTRSRSPLSEMNRLAREMDSLFGGFNGPTDLWSPPVDVEETGDELILTAELPGMDRENIDIELEDGVLTIQGEKKEEQKDEGTQGLLYERRWGSFTRRFTLPRAVDANNITANYENGILTIRVPKAEEAKGRKIEIAGSGRDVS